LMHQLQVNSGTATSAASSSIIACERSTLKAELFRCSVLVALACDKAKPEFVRSAVDGFAHSGPHHLTELQIGFRSVALSYSGGLANHRLPKETETPGGIAKPSVKSNRDLRLCASGQMAASLTAMMPCGQQLIEKRVIGTDRV